MRPNKRRRLLAPAVAAAGLLSAAAGQLQLQPTFAPTILPAENITVYQTSSSTASYAPASSLPASLGTSTAATNQSSAGNTPTLVPPPIPDGLPATLALDLTTQPAGLGPVVKGPFAGFSIELSVVAQVLGRTGANVQVPFLNYIENIRSRAAAAPIVRLGGNTQDSSQYNASAVAAVQKGDARVQSVDTPSVELGPELFRLMRNVSDLVGVEWVFGINFNQPDANAVETSAAAQAALGSSLLTLQLGNEPDLYVSHEERSADYNISSYVDEFGVEVGDISAASGFNGKGAFAGPSVCCDWTIDEILDAGYLERYASNLGVLSIQRYPDNNCAATGKTNGRIDTPQSVFQNYLNHTGATYFINNFANATAQARQANLPFMMFETNTASCGGFPGVSDSFGAALWMVDYSLALAERGFAAALYHVGGQNVFYNAFTAPPTNQSSFRGWDTGALYYGFLVVAEALGQKNASQVAELTALSDATNGTFAGYSIYEGTTAQRALLINYATGNAAYTAQLRVPSSTTSVAVKYLQAASTAEHYNISWAGQTLGGAGPFSSDGLAVGTQQTSTITCTTSSTGAGNVCSVSVPAPGIALVALTPDAASVISAAPVSSSGFPVTVSAGTLSIDQAALQTSNGGMGRPRGSDGGLGGTDVVRSGAVRLFVGTAVVLPLVVSTVVFRLFRK